jgi:hypothetical protein
MGINQQAQAIVMQVGAVLGEGGGCGSHNSI